MAKKTGKKPYKFRQARKDAKAGAKQVFSGKRQAAVKDITTKLSLEDREALKDLSDARKRQRAGKADFIIDDRGNRVEVKPTETPQERIARDRAEARRLAYEKYPLDETELDKRKASKARMEAKNKAAIAKQEADRAARRGRNAPPLQQTPANEKPLSRPVKKAAARKGTVGTTKKPDAKGIAKVVEEAKAAAAKNKPQIKKAVAEAKAKKYPNAKPIGTMSFKNGKMTFKPAEGFNFNELGKRRLDQMKKAGISEADAKKVLGTNKPAYEKKMTRAERSAANKAAWAKMSPAERKNWSANKPSAKAPVQSVTNVQPEKAGKGTKKPKFVQKSVATTKEAAKPSTGKALAVRSKGVVATTKAVGAEGAKKAAKAGALRTAGRFAGKLVGGRVGAALAIGSIAAGPIKNALSKDTKGRTTFDVLDKRAKAAAAAGGAKLDKAQYGRALPGGVKKAGRTAIAGGALLSGGVRKEAIAKGRIPATPGPGGSTIKQGSGYRVETGDTLSSIAKRANVTLAELREANKKIKDPRKIYRNTLIRIPKSGTTPNPMYTGPVPYVPGSKAAKKYEQSRKK